MHSNPVKIGVHVAECWRKRSYGGRHRRHCGHDRDWYSTRAFLISMRVSTDRLADVIGSILSEVMRACVGALVCKKGSSKMWGREWISLNSSKMRAYLD